MKKLVWLSLLLASGQLYANTVRVVLTNNSDIDYIFDSRLPDMNSTSSGKGKLVRKGDTEVHRYVNVTRIFWGSVWGKPDHPSYSRNILPAGPRWNGIDVPANEDVTVLIDCDIEHPRCSYKIVTAD